jgi:hypothetical protein
MICELRVFGERTMSPSVADHGGISFRKLF